VVHPSEPSRLLGYLGRTAILSARKHQHDEELVRRRAEEAALSVLAGRDGPLHHGGLRTR